MIPKIVRLYFDQVNLDFYGISSVSSLKFLVSERKEILFVIGFGYSAYELSDHDIGSSC